MKETLRLLIDDIVQGKITEFAIIPLVYNLYKKKYPAKLNKLEFCVWLSGFIDAEGNFQVFFDRKSSFSQRQVLIYIMMM